MELLDGRNLASYSLVPIPNTVYATQALIKYPLTDKQVKEMGQACCVCGAVGFVLYLLALPCSIAMSAVTCQRRGAGGVGGWDDTMREAVHTEKHASGDALLPLQLVDGWLSYAGRASVSAARWHVSQGAGVFLTCLGAGWAAVC